MIDDDDLLRPVVERGLSRKGIEVRCLDNPGEALALSDAEKAEVGLLLCDGSMAGFDPEALKVDFAQHSPEVELVVSSGFTAGILQDRGIKVDPDRFLQKPWAFKELVAFVQKLLGPAE